MGKAKLNIPMCAALVLLLLTMITTHMTADLYAKYTTTASGEDGARVAKFAVACKVTANTDENPADAKSPFTVTVINNSDVAVEYDLVVISKNLSAKIADVGPTSTEGNEKTFKNAAWKLAPNADAAHKLELEITDWTGLTDSQTDKGKTEDVVIAFDVHVVATQID